MQCNVPDLSIHYESVGRGRPFLMLHGSPGDGARARADVEPAFRSRRNWKRIYPDLPGHGQTPGTRRIRDIDGYLGVLLELVDELFPRQRFCLGGHSFGAYLALGIARKRRARIEGLLLSSPEVNFSPREERRERAAPTVPAKGAQAPDAQRYSEDTAWLESLPYRDLSFDLYRGSPSFTIPTLFLFGRQDAPFRYQDYWKLMPNFPNATFAVLDSAGHSLWEDRRRLLDALVGDWLDRIEARKSL
jgi:pimeloyl-ACP methyl ester carboxylesterase